MDIRDQNLRELVFARLEVGEVPDEWVQRVLLCISGMIQNPATSEKLMVRDLIPFSGKTRAADFEDEAAKACTWYEN